MREFITGYLGSVRGAWEQGSGESPWRVARGLAPAFAVVACSTCFGVLGAPHGSPDTFFREGWLIDWLSSAFLLAGAIAAFVAWSHRAAKGVLADWLWFVFGLAAVFLAFDERFQLHERAHFVAEAAVGGPAWFRNWNDVVVAAYLGSAALLALMLFPSLLRERLAFVALVVGFGFGAIHSLIDSIADESDYKNVFEESFKGFMSASIAGGACLAASRRLREGWPRSEGRTLIAAAALVTLSAVVALHSRAWNDSAPLPWGDAHLWFVGALAFAAAYAALFMGDVRRAHRPAQLVAACVVFGLYGLAVAPVGFRKLYASFVPHEGFGAVADLARRTFGFGLSWLGLGVLFALCLWLVLRHPGRLLWAALAAATLTLAEFGAGVFGVAGELLSSFRIAGSVALTAGLVGAAMDVAPRAKDESSTAL